MYILGSSATLFKVKLLAVMCTQLHSLVDSKLQRNGLVLTACAWYRLVSTACACAKYPTIRGVSDIYVRFQYISAIYIVMAQKKRITVLTTYMAARITVQFELPCLGKSVKYLSSLYAQAGYKTALYSNYSLQLTVIGRKYTVKYKRNPCACANSRYQAVSLQL